MPLRTPLSSHLPPFFRGIFCLTVFFLGAMVLTALATEWQQPEPMEPTVAEASEEAAEAMGVIRLRKGWDIGLFAAEPQVANIVAFDIDPQGRFWVCESYRQERGVTDNRAHDEAWVLADLASKTVQDRIDYHQRLLGEAAVTYAQHDDRLKWVEDTDGDSVADRSGVFANGFNRIEEGTGAGVLARGGEVFYSNIPKLWKLIDTDDDGVADERVVMSDGYGVKVAFRGHDLHGLLMGPDGRLYFTIGDRGYNITTDDGRVLANSDSGAVFRCELDGTGLEVVANGLRNPQELAFNDQGDFFSVDNNSDSGDQARIVQILEGGDSGWRMHYQYLPDRGPFNREKIWEPFHAEQPAYLVPPIANFTDGPSGFAYYPGTGFGDQLKDTFLICDFRGGPANSGIRSFKLEPDGAFFKLAEDSDPVWNVLATDVAFGPDGALYLSDWVDGWKGLGKGRIYRVTDPDEIQKPIVAEVRELLRDDWSETETGKLRDLLSHADRRVRLEAQWELAARGDHESLLLVAADPEKTSVARLHGVWGISQIVRSWAIEQDPTRESLSDLLATIRPLLSEDQPILQAAVAQIVGDHGGKASLIPLRQLIGHSSDRVKYFAIMALGKLHDDESFSAVVELLKESNDADPVLRHAGVMYLSQAATEEEIATLIRHDSVAVRRCAVVALRRLPSGKLTDFLKDEDESVVLEAATAIHDLSVLIAQKSLAEMIDQPMKHPELIRRVLNMNYRMGTLESATRLATYAGRVTSPSEARIEALDALAAWANPDPRDRVLNVYRPLPKRSAADATKALLPQIDSLMASQESVREKAIDVASSLGVQEIVPFLIARIEKEEGRSSLRADALVALARLDSKEAVLLAEKVKLRPTSDLVLAAMRVLFEHQKERSLEKFIEATRSRDARVRGLGWDLLAAMPGEASDARMIEGIEQYLDGSLPPDVQLNVIEAARGRLPEALQAKFDLHTKSLAQSDKLGPWLSSLEGGDVARGAKLFLEKTELSCVRCHKVDRAGGEVGPNLTVIGKENDRRYLLEAIALPSETVAKGYETIIIANDSGEVFSGIVQSETEDMIELIQNDGSLVKVPTEEIMARKKGNSSMPEDLTKLMTPRELRDLVAYLASLQIDPRASTDTE